MRVDWEPEEIFQKNPILFVDFMKKGIELNDR